MKTLSEQEKKKQQQLQEWLDKVHFGSCCSDIATNDVTLPEKNQASDDALSKMRKK